MSKSIFAQCDGVVSKVPFNCENGAVFKFTINNSPITMPVTGFMLELSGNYQFLHTVSDFIYFYAFGDRVGELTISGMGFIGKCPGQEDGGLCKAYTYYTENRIAAKGDALPISMDSCGSFFGFLTGMRLEIPKADLPIGQYSLRFHVVPNKN
jgi:hypothetical protein